MPHSLKKHARGYVLLPVALTLAVVAAVAFLLTQQGAFNAGSVLREQQKDTALYAAEAGLNHAKWTLNRLNCSGYTDISSTSLGAHSYTASVTDDSGAALTSGSPANISVTGTHANGASYSLERNGVKIYQFPTQQLFLQPDATAGKDTYFYEWKSTWNYGLSTEFWVDNVFLDSEAHSLLQFDLSGLPANAVIQSATLELYQHSPSAKGGDVSVHRVTGAWEEGIKTGGIGASSWTESAPAINWTNAGGDYDATAATTTSVAAGGVGWYQWDIKSLVQGWADASYPNQGLMLVPTTPNSSAYFRSSDYSTPLLRPKLSITYACECGVVCGGPPPGISGNLLFVSAGFVVVAFPSGETTVTPTTEEAARITLMQAWGYDVTLIHESSDQADFDTALATTDVVYVPSTIDKTNLSAKLDTSTKGVVFELHNLAQNFGLADTPDIGPLTTDIQILDNSHYITANFPLGSLPLFSSAVETRKISGTITPDNIALASTSGTQVLDALEKGARQYDDSISPGRRVKLPWGAVSFDPALLTAEGETLMQRAIEWGAAIDPGLLAHWKMDEGTGSTAADSVGGHHGTLTGPGWATGQIDGASSFDGSNDFIDVPHDEGLWLTGELTFTAWINAASFGSGNQTIISKDTPGNGASNYWFGTWQNELVFGFFASGAFRTVQTTGLGLLPNVWYLLAASFDNATDEVLLYVNGTLLKTGSIAFEPTTETANLWLGKSVDNEYWPGRLDDVRIYDRALHASEVSALFTGGGGTVAPPVQQGYLDQFNSLTCNAAVDFIGSDGSLDWSTSQWVERSESDGPCAGLTRIGDDPVVPEAGSHRLILNEKLSGASRTVDLSTVANATLSFDYRRDNYPTSSDRFVVEVNNGIGSGWVVLDSITGIANDPAYLSASYDISAHATASTQIRFSTEGINTLQTLYLDNIKISEGAGGAGAPTNFGFETIFDQTQSSVRRKQIATQVSLPEDGTITSISAYVGGANKIVRYAIYTDETGEPGTLLAESDNLVTPSGMSWFTIDVPATALTAGTYWLALSFEDNNHQYTYQTGGQTRYNNNRATTNGYTSSWGSSSATYSRTISIYGTYTPAN